MTNDLSCRQGRHYLQKGGLTYCPARFNVCLLGFFSTQAKIIDIYIKPVINIKFERNLGSNFVETISSPYNSGS